MHLLSSTLRNDICQALPGASSPSSSLLSSKGSSNTPRCFLCGCRAGCASALRLCRRPAFNASLHLCHQSQASWQNQQNQDVPQSGGHAAGIRRKTTCSQPGAEHTALPSHILRTSPAASSSDLRPLTAQLMNKCMGLLAKSLCLAAGSKPVTALPA